MDRFTAFTTLFDPATFRHLDGLGLAQGWRCWEVGAGGTSVVDFLSERVGPAGHVLATDINLSWAAAAAPQPPPRPTAPPPHPTWTCWSTMWRRALPRAARSTWSTPVSSWCTCPSATERWPPWPPPCGPGGVMLVEDADPALQPLSCLEEIGPPQELANRIRRGFRQLLAERGVDLAYGRTLPRRLRAVGLVQVAADAAFPVSDPACNALETATINLIRDQLLDHGIATEDEIARHLANVAAGTLDLAQPPMISCWGRRPLPG